ncbi:30S ribosomal protein S4 [Candidatus Woesearchaeota archaeon]|nr:30S ribosomal protein S4 [Candidatus Woesearchaeota archaeon]
MGSPKKLRKKYQTLGHPWKKETIEKEKVLVNEFGLKKKKEIRIADSFLKKYKNIAKRLIADYTAQGAKEKEQMMQKLQRLGLLSQNAKLDDVLSLEVKDVLARRVQSQLFKKGLARTTQQARQMIVHGHVTINGKAVTFPSYLVSLEEESSLGFNTVSTFADEHHPERLIAVKEIQKEKEAIKKSAKKSLQEEQKEVPMDSVPEVGKPSESVDLAEAAEE